MDSEQVTVLLERWRNGDKTVEEPLLEIVYKQWRGQVHHYKKLAMERVTLQTTEVIHELYLRMQEGGNFPEWQNRNHFSAISARLIRRILVDQARSRGAAKRGGFAADLGLDFEIRDEGLGQDVEKLDDALQELQDVNPQLVQIVELRFFAGFSREEIAKTLDISVPTVGRRYKFARQWLFQKMR